MSLCRRTHLVSHHKSTVELVPLGQSAKNGYGTLMNLSDLHMVGTDSTTTQIYYYSNVEHCWRHPRTTHSNWSSRTGVFSSPTRHRVPPGTVLRPSTTLLDEYMHFRATSAHTIPAPDQCLSIRTIYRATRFRLVGPTVWN